MRRIPTFLILCHADPICFRRLVGRLVGVGNIVAHVDSQADESLFRCPSVTFTKKRVDIRWAGFSMVVAALELLKTALTNYPNSTHYVLLSGADYPLVSNKEMGLFFCKNIGYSNICFVNVRQSSDHYKKMISRYCFRDVWGTRGAKFYARASRKLAEIALIPFAKKFPDQLIPCFGSSWWSLSADCASYVVERIEKESFWFRYWRFIASPDEQIFHTVVANSPFLKKSGGFFVMQGHSLAKLANLHHIHPSLTKIYTLDDWSEVEKSEKIFLRKVDSVRSKALLDKLDERAYWHI